MKRSKPWVHASAFALGTLWPAIALSCPVCGGGGDSPRSQLAFFNTTILLSLLPLGMIGGGVLWLRHDARDFLSGEFEERDAHPPAEEQAPELRLMRADPED